MGIVVKIINILIVAIIVFLSIAAGVAKVMQTQQEMEFLLSVGLSRALIIIFGLAQIAGGVLLIPRKTRMSGAIMTTIAFVISTVLIFVGGNFLFGLFSILPITLAGAVIYKSARTTHSKSLNAGASEADTS